MFSTQITDSDAFLTLPATTQALYFHLAMHGDDDGFVNSPKRIMRQIGASDDELPLLAARGFIIPFESGVIVIKHWRIHNYLRNDRYKPTVYVEEMGSLSLKDNGAYTLEGEKELSSGADTAGIPVGIPSGTQNGTENFIQCEPIEEKEVSSWVDTVGIPSGSVTEQNRTEHNKHNNKKKEPRHKYGMYKNVLLSDTDLEKLKTEFPSDWEQRIERLSEYMESRGKHYKNHLATIRSWAKRDAPPPKKGGGHGKYSD